MRSFVQNPDRPEWSTRIVTKDKESPREIAASLTAILLAYDSAEESTE